MRASQGVPHGRNVLLYNPELFQEHDEVIIFRREDFKNRYTSIRKHIEHISRLDMEIERDEGWMLLGYWPVIMEKIQLIEFTMDLIFKEEPLQTYLDAYLCSTSGFSMEELAESDTMLPGKSRVRIKPIEF